MDVLDLPSLSDDDELDYELADADGADTILTEKETEKRDQRIKEASTSAAQYEVEKDSAYSEKSTQQETSTTSFSTLNSRKRKQVESLRNSDLSEEEEEDYGHENQEDEEEDAQMVIKLPGRLAGRVKRINKAKQIEAPERDEEESLTAERFAQILDGKGTNQRNLSDKELEDLYASLEVDPDLDEKHLRFNALFIAGADVKKLTQFDISRIFAQYEPESVRPLDSSVAFVVTFVNALFTAQVLLEMSKPLRRVRKPKKPEEGELVESSDEEGEEGLVKEEGGEDVAIVKDTKRGKMLRANSDVVEVDVEEVKVPPGKWRVITQHVPENKLIYVRFATGFELRRSIFVTKEQEHFEFLSNKNAKVRPGLNVFDEKGNELDWDYEHDTRFFEDYNADDAKSNTGRDQPETAGNGEQQKEVETEVAGIKIRSRGRGTKKFLQALKDSDED